MDGGGGHAQDSDSVTGGGRVLTRSKGVSGWGNVTGKKKIEAVPWEAVIRWQHKQ